MTEPVLPEPARVAVDLFRSAPVGEQLANLDECPNRCIKASAKFKAALDHCGTTGMTIYFTGMEGSTWHHATAVCGYGEISDETLIVDWTARQYAADAPYPLIETFESTLRRWQRPVFLDWDRRQYTGMPSESYFPGPWPEAGERIED